MKIGILTHDNGEYDAYVGFFSDGDRLKAAIAKLKAERLDEFGEEPDVDAIAIALEDVPEVIDDAFLDRLAGMLSEACIEVERTEERNERLAKEVAESEAALVCPGQIGIDEVLP